jgi:hypothetical protein
MDWYEERVEGLGAQFLDRVVEALDYVSLFPDSCPILLGRVRRKVMRQFLTASSIVSHPTRSSFWPLRTKNVGSTIGKTASE